MSRWAGGRGARALGACALLVACGGPKPPPGLIVISVDTLRADAIEPLGAPAGSSPTLARIAREGVLFERAYAQANETQPSHAALFTSQLPSALGPVDSALTIPDGTPTLASSLAAAGWRTGAVVAGGHLARVLGLDDGFQQYVEARRMGSFQQTVPLGLRWLDEARAGDAPWMLFLHSYDCHIPYSKPQALGRSATPGYRGPMLDIVHDPLSFEAMYQRFFFPRLPVGADRDAVGAKVKAPETAALMTQWVNMPEVEKQPLTDADVAFLRGLYATSAFYADLWLGVLWQELDARGVLDDSVVVILSDHGEDLLEHGWMSHHHVLTDSSTHVPLIVRLPGGEGGGQRVREVVELIDVAPTLLGLQGLPIPETMTGVDRSACLRGGGCGGGPGVARSEAKNEQVSATDGFFRMTVSGAPAGSPAMAARVRRLEPSAVRLWDTTKGSGSEQALDLRSFDPERVGRLRAALLGEGAP